MRSGRTSCSANMQSLRRLVIRTGLAGLLGILGPAAIQAESLTLSYLVGWGHMTLVEAEISYSQSEIGYHLVSKGRTRGLLDLFFSWQGQAETEGLRLKEGRRPLVHEHEGTRKKKIRRTRVDWNGAAGPRTEAEPPSDLERVTPVPKSSIAGTSDPFTVILSLLDQLAATGRCEGEAKVWDGRRRYDLSVTHLGEEELIADRPWSYGGQAIGCALDIKRIGGFRREKPDWRSRDENAPTRRVVWAAEIESGHWALVRGEMETQYGTVVGRLLSGEYKQPEHVQRSLEALSAVGMPE